MKNPKLIEEAILGFVEVLDDDSKITKYLETHDQSVIEEAIELIEEKGYIKGKAEELKGKLVKRFAAGARNRGKVAADNLSGKISRAAGLHNKKIAEFADELIGKMLRKEK